MRDKLKWLKVIERWQKDNEEIDPDSLAMNGQYAWQKPWMIKVSTGKDTYDYANLPLEVQESILEGLLNIYNSWQNQLANLPGNYDLKIWIYHPEFIRSFIAVTQRDVTKYNEEDLIESNEGFPIKLFPGLNNELEKLKFSGYVHTEHFYRSEFGDCLYWGYKFEEEPPSKDYMLAEMARLGATKENVLTDVKYTVRKGNLWIGTAIEF